MKSKFIDYMIKNKFTEGTDRWVSSSTIEQKVDITRHDVEELVKYNPDYIESDHEPYTVCYRITKKHKKDFPEYYL